MNYRFAYTIGFHPWEDAATDPPFVKKISEVLAREEQGHEKPFGRALDVGTGSGIWGIELAKRGWHVTGVDIIDKALQRARERVGSAGVDMRVVAGDITSLDASDVGDGYELILDTGTFHGFGVNEQRAMGRELNRIASHDATILLLVWPKKIRPLIRGASRGEVETAFPDWEISHVEPSYFTLPKVMELVLKPDEHWDRLRRK